MPHFIIDCSENILQERTAEELMNAVYEVAASSGLFADNDIKVRLQSNQHFKLGEGKTSFIHVFGYIMEGRSPEQKANLSRDVTAKLVALVKDTSFLSMNIWDFERATYCNKSLINPANKNKDRHFEL